MAVTLNNTEDLLRYPDAARELGRSVKRVQQAIHAGILHPVKLPGQTAKYLQRDEIEWFKDKTLTEANAILYREMQKQQEPESKKSWTERLREFLMSDEFAMIFATIIFSLGLSSDNASTKELARRFAISKIEEMRDSEESRLMRKQFAVMLAEILASDDLGPRTFANRKILKEILDALLDRIAEEQETTSIPA